MTSVPDRHEKIGWVGRGSPLQPGSCLAAAGHAQLLSTSTGARAGQLLPGFAGRTAVRCLYSCIRYLKAEGSEESKAGREGKRQKKKKKGAEIPARGETGCKSRKQGGTNEGKGERRTVLKGEK